MLSIRVLSCLKNIEGLHILFQISACEHCQKEDKIKTVAPELKPIETERPWEKVTISQFYSFSKKYARKNGKMNIVNISSGRFNCHKMYIVIRILLYNEYC